MDQPHITAVLTAIEAKLRRGEDVPASYLLVGPPGLGQDEVIGFLARHELVAVQTTPSLEQADPEFLLAQPLIFTFLPTAPSPVPAHVPAFLHAVASNRFSDALDIAADATERSGSITSLIDGCIQSLVERLTSESPRAAVTAIRSLWEMRWRLSQAPTPLKPTLAVLLSELAPALSTVVDRPSSPSRPTTPIPVQPSLSQLQSLIRPA